MVPFEKIGPGQSVRLAWQVMGKNGPIPNPAGVRYLPADAGVVLGGPQNLLYASTALAGLNLIASVANVAIAAQTLQELRRVSRRVDELITGQCRIESKVEEAIAGIKRVEVGVSEARLARVVSNALRAASSDDGLTFEPFHQLADDLQSFLDDAGIARGKVTSFRLGSDLRNDLHNIARLLRGVRLRLATHWNRHQVDPTYVWRCDPLDDYWSAAEIGVAHARAIGVHNAAISVVHAMASAHRGVDRCFSFNSADDHAKIQSSLVADALKPMWQSMTGVDDVVFCETLDSMEAAGLDRLGGRNLAAMTTPWLNDDYQSGYLEAAAIMSVVDANIASETGEVPPSIFFLPTTDAELDLGTVLKDFRRWWLYNTDDGVVYRAWLECAGVASGYAEVWPELDVLNEGQTIGLSEPEPVRIEFESEARADSAVKSSNPVRRFR